MVKVLASLLIYFTGLSVIQLLLGLTLCVVLSYFRYLFVWFVCRAVD